MKGIICKALFLICSVAFAAPSDTTVVRVGVGYSVPWAYLGPDGAPIGFYIEVMREAARREGLGFESVFRRDGPEIALRSGEIDLWAAAVATPERRARLYFSEPWWSQDHYLAILRSGPASRIEELAGRTVLYSPAPPFTVPLDQVVPGAILKPVGDLRERFVALCAGQADGVLFYHETALFSVTGSNEFAACREKGLRLLPVGRPVMQVSVAALPANQPLADRIRARLEEMRADGTLARFAAHPLTGNESLTRLIEVEETRHQERVLRIVTLSLSVLCLVTTAAYFRLRRANRRAQAALALAESASRAKSEFLATMSHEIRTPMTAVLGYMDLLMATPLRHDQRRFAVEVTQATEALLTLITTILSYARPGRVDPPPPSQTLDPSAVLDDCVAAVLVTAEAKGLALSVELDASIPRRLAGDAVGLRQALLNLLGNAVKFTSRGWVRLHASYDGSALICVVSDSGDGIPAEKRKVIFEPFTQIDSSDKRRFGGIGLGLAVVADFCRRVDGQITVGDAPGGGACFTLRIPYLAPPGDEHGWLGPRVDGAAALLLPPSPDVDTVAAYFRAAGLAVEILPDPADLLAWPPPADGLLFYLIDASNIPTVLPPRRDPHTRFILTGRMPAIRAVAEERMHLFDDILILPAAARTIRDILHPSSPRAAIEPVVVRRHVLVVDDNPVNRRVLGGLLEKLGCQVESARNGREAVDAAIRSSFTAVFMDCQMPVMNGYEATAEIRRLSHASHVPIIGISASLDAETRQRCEDAGMNEYLPKPVTLLVLQDVLTRLSAHQIIAENIQTDR